MTRSIGDFYAHSFGLTNQPTIMIEEIPASEKTQFYVTIGSDGIWDCWKYEEFADYILTLMNQNSDKTEAIALSNTCQDAVTYTVKKAIEKYSFILSNI